MPNRPSLHNSIMLFAAIGLMPPHQREAEPEPMVQKYAGLLAATALRKHR
jgi:hypothetical protein